MKLHDATEAALETPLVQARLREVGAPVVTPDRRSPNYMQSLLASEFKRWEAIIRAANIVVD
jgi:tripartite-type tricarboxylate transporter receptor subunit TctC